MKTLLESEIGSLMTGQPEKMENLTGRRVTVVGLARAGLASALLSKQRGAEVFVTDAKPKDELTQAIRALDERNVGYETGGHTDRALDGCDLVVVSPGVPLDLPLLLDARSRSIPIISEIEAAFRT